MKNLSSPRDFAKGIESRQQMHSWIACYLREGGKLLRSDFFLEIDVIFAFLWSIYPTFWQPNWGQISPDNRITLRAGRALRVMWIFVVERMHPCGAWAPGSARKIDLKLTRIHFSKKFRQFRSHEKSLLPEGFRPRNRIETTNAFLDSLSPQRGRKIAPEQFLFGNRCDIFIFLTILPNFLTTQLKSNFPRQSYYS